LAVLFYATIIDKFKLFFFLQNNNCNKLMWVGQHLKITIIKGKAAIIADHFKETFTHTTTVKTIDSVEPMIRTLAALQ
jgi:hypothetical protein